MVYIVCKTNYCAIGSFNLLNMVDCFIEAVVDHLLDLLEVSSGHLPFLLKILQRYPAVTSGLEKKTSINLQTHIKQIYDVENAKVSHASNKRGLVGLNKVQTS